MYLLLLVFANPYTRYIFERLIMMIFVAFGVVLVVFTILHFASSNPALNVLGEYATEQQVADFNRMHGLDQPYLVQLFRNFKNLATFQLGNSYQGNEDVMAAILRKFPVTLEMSVYAFLIAVVISIPIGIVSAIKPNTAFDYIFMFPMKLGLAGAALATAISPAITMAICTTHYLGKKNHVGFRWVRPSIRHLVSCCQLGISAFVGELSSAIITIIFNMLLLGIAGNVSVAAYGVVANLSLVAMSIFNGLAQGAQPYQQKLRRRTA